MKKRRISTRKFIEKASTDAFIKTKDSVQTNNWTSFESSVAISALVASFYGGFSGLPFSTWLQKFLYELSTSDNALELIYDMQFDLYKNELIPFCAPSIKANWFETFGSYLVKDCNAEIGVIDAFLDQASRDFFIKRLGDKNAIISGECKDHKSKLSLKQILKIVNKLNAFDSKLNLIVIRALSESIFKKRNDFKEFPENISLFILRKEKTLNLECIYQGKDKADLKFFLLIELNQL